jgi:hypothetical protein
VTWWRGAALAAGALLLAATPARARVLWSGDFETGDIGQWNEKLNAANTAPARVTVVAAPVRQGKHAGRVEVRNDDLWSNGLNRVELGHHPDPTTFENSERTYAWSMMVPRAGTWDAREKQIAYFEADVIYMQVMSFVVHGQDIQLVTRLPADTVRWDGAGQLTRGRWHDFVLHVRWSTDARAGFVELWFDGQQVVPRTAVATMRKDAAGQPKANFLHLGIFRGPPPPTPTVEVMYLDAAAEATAVEDLLQVRKAPRN